MVLSKGAGKRSYHKEKGPAVGFLNLLQWLKFFKENPVSDEKAEIKLLTLEEANAALPKVVIVLKSLRELRDKVLRIQAQIEIEEMTGTDSEGRLSQSAQSAVTLLMDEFQAQTHHFEELLEDLFQMGAHLKDLNTGLIDFYSLRNKEVVFLCWKEGEPDIRHWHSLEGGFQSRQPLD